MRNILAIVERELRSYFSSPIAYVVLTLFTFLSGILFTLFLRFGLDTYSRNAMQSAQFGQPPRPMDVPAEISQGYLDWMTTIFLFIVPMITMALFSEEKRRGTMELLLTAPLTDAQVVLGKFVAAVSFFCILLVSTWIPMAALFLFGQPAWGPILTAYVGLLLYGLAIVSIGMFISSLTENQIVAAMLTFGAVLFLWMVPALANRVENQTGKEVLNYLAITTHLTDFYKGVFVTSHIIFYLSASLIALFLTYRSIDSLRWRG